MIVAIGKGSRDEPPRERENARTLGLLKRSATPAVFQKIVWGNAHKLLRIPA